MNAPSPTPLGPKGWVRLDDWGVIRARGADAATFLHGQLTQDITHLDATQAVLAGYCSAKGRLLATFVVWRPQADELLLACSADLLPTVLKRLTMFVLRAKCKLDDASAEWPLWGGAGSGIVDGDEAPWRRIAGGGSIGDTLTLPPAVVDGVVVPRVLRAGGDEPQGDALSAEDWRWLEARCGVARISAATVEQFVPQMVNLELVGGVNFQKGCYPGQEVVARSQYRGTLKRRATAVDSPQPLSPGQEVFHSADPGQPAGRVVLAGTLDGTRHGGLVEVKLAATLDGALHLGAPDGPVLTLQALPYAIPAEAE